MSNNIWLYAPYVFLGIGITVAIVSRFFIVKEKADLIHYWAVTVMWPAYLLTHIAPKPFRETAKALLHKKL